MYKARKGYSSNERHLEWVLYTLSSPQHLLSFPRYGTFSATMVEQEQIPSKTSRFSFSLWLTVTHSSCLAKVTRERGEAGADAVLYILE